MMHRRTQQLMERRAAGCCQRCGQQLDRSGALCSRCLQIVNGRNRQRYRPGGPAGIWTSSMMARYAALESRGWL